MMTVTSSFGVFLSVAIFDSILAANVRPDGTHDWAPPYLAAFAISAVLAVLTAVMFKPETQRR